MRDLAHCRVLVVDDVKSNVDILVKGLSKEYKVATAKDGNQALESAAQATPDLVLLDIVMPGLDGYEVCRRLKRDPKTKDTPVLFISSLDEIGSKTAGFQAGAVDYITKPFDIIEVKARVRTHLSLKLAREGLIETMEELRRSREEYRTLSLRDNLTGLYNTRYLYQALSELVAQSTTNNTPFSLIFMDVDNFKRVVDGHGHLNGSRALQELAGVIRDCLEKPAYGVAYGGDEFVAVLPGMDKRQAVQKAEEIRSGVRETSYLGSQGLSVRLTASYGVATFPDDACDLTALLGLADKAMFHVKETGKDAVGASSTAQPKTGGAPCGH